MASSNYDSVTSTALCGFDKYPPQKLEDQNRGLTEGFTEIITFTGVLNSIEIASDYCIEVLLLQQLMQIIGTEELIKCYFSNLGIEPIKQKLQEIILNPNMSYQLFRNIELNYQIRHSDEQQNVLAAIQSTLVDYLTAKIEKMSNLDKDEEIKKLLSTYELYLITPEILQLMKKNPSNYIGLSTSIEKFYQLKNEIIGLQSEDLDKKSK